MKKGKKGLIALVLLMGIGFAAIATTLYINGTANISNADFEVIFTAASVDGTDITSTGITDNGTRITYTTSDLAAVGDTSVLNFTVKNNSPMYDATVSISCTAEGENNEYYTVTPLIDGVASTTIESMHTKDGTVTVSLAKVSTNAISEQFTCTINATAVERTTVGEEPVVGFQPTYFAFGDVTTASPTTAPAGKRVYAALDSQGNKGVCINMNGTVHCFQINNAAYELQHAQQVFNQHCEYFSEYSRWICNAGLFGCTVGSNGDVSCNDGGPNEYCAVGSNGDVGCGQ